ncbi:MAG: hypothetical protein SFU25_09440, partial [Candidatus Caenarcaniphilales bacterium]|nr:hypothetical protein [Candidatus Caenarcaniphilales bacterium]
GRSVSDLSKEALQVLQQTVREIRSLNSYSLRLKNDPSLLVMSSEDIANALLKNMNPAQFSNPGDIPSKD